MDERKKAYISIMNEVDKIKEETHRLSTFKFTGNVLILGLENAGKTTFMLKMHEYFPGGILDTSRAEYVESLQMQTMMLMTYDLGGYRQLWKYASEMDAIIFMIDATDPYRFLEVKEEFTTVVNDHVLSKKPIAVIANKTDISTHSSENVVRDLLELHDERLNGHPVKLFMCSINNHTGYIDVLNWLQYNK